MYELIEADNFKFISFKIQFIGTSINNNSVSSVALIPKSEVSETPNASLDFKLMSDIETPPLMVKTYTP